MPLQEGDKAPAFSLYNQDNKKIALKDFVGKTVILYFYPKDLTPGCTSEACDFRDAHSKIKRKDCVVLGISKDGVDLHKKFADKYELNFSLLADIDGKVCEKYGVWQEKNLYGKKSMGIVRTTFVIDGNGKIVTIFNKVRVNGHIEKIMECL